MKKSNKFLNVSRAAVLGLLIIPCLLSALSETTTKKSESIELSSYSSCLTGVDKNVARQKIAKFAESTLYISTRRQNYPYNELALPWRCSLFTRVSVGDGVASLYPKAQQKWAKDCLHAQLFRGSAKDTSVAWQSHGWTKPTYWVQANGGLQNGDILFQPNISVLGHIAVVVLKNGKLMVAENNGYPKPPPRFFDGKTDYRRLVPLANFGQFQSVGRFGGF